MFPVLLECSVCVSLPTSCLIVSLSCVWLFPLSNVSHLYPVVYLSRVYLTPVFSSSCARLSCLPSDHSGIYCKSPCLLVSDPYSVSITTFALSLPVLWHHFDPLFWPLLIKWWNGPWTSSVLIRGNWMGQGVYPTSPHVCFYLEAYERVPQGVLLGCSGGMVVVGLYYGLYHLCIFAVRTAFQLPVS